MKQPLVTALILVGLCISTSYASHADRYVGSPDAPSITVADTVLGQTTTYIGATEAGEFYWDDLADLGINVYRMWTKMNELEWWDDDDYQLGEECNEVGRPDISTIKLDQPNGFANTIPWSFWDDVFQNQEWWSGNSREEVIQQCVDSGVTPVLMLRNIDDQGEPDWRTGCPWAPKPPVDQDFLDEWWEHAFAIAYWLNVRHTYGVTHFEVLNEPDLPSQGWDGNQDEYVQLVETAYDAVKFANDIAGIDTFIHAPVVASYNSTYVANSLDNADNEITVVDYHNYDQDPTTSLAAISNTIASHNPDGVTEPIWVSEWGTYTDSYDSLDRAILTAQQLMTFSEQGVEGVTIFGMYDWGSFSGLLDADRNRTETYYAYRLMTRGLKNAKDRLQFTASGVGDDVIITAGGGKVYVIVINDGDSAFSDIQVDMSDLGIDDGAVSVREYSSSNKDAVVGAPAMTGGCFTLSAPANSIVLAEAEPSDTLMELASLTATAHNEYVRVEWETLSEIDNAGFNLWRAQGRAEAYAHLNAELIPSRGSPIRGATYAYLDAAVTDGMTYSYKLEEVDILGASTFHGPVSVTISLPDGEGCRLYLPVIIR
jgi:hypothetical protein